MARTGARAQIREAVLYTLLSALCAFPLNLNARDAHDEANQKIEEVRRQFKAFENAWNQGDIEGVIRQYDPSVDLLVKSERWDYDKEVAYLKGLMSAKSRARLRFDVDFVRPLGADYALVDGSFHLTAADGAEESGPFTAIWMRTGSGWQCVYSRS
jgi:ketosteroid isomerase-like protein